MDQQLARGMYISLPNSIRVTEACRAFLVDYAGLVTAGKRERSTLEGYRQHFQHHIKQHDIACIPLSRLTSPDCADFARWLERTRSDQMARRVMATLRMVLDFARENGLIYENYARGIRVRTAGDRYDQGPIEIPLKSDLRLLLQVAERFDSRGYALALVSVLMFCGLRASEVRGLRQQDLLGNVIRVRQRADRWNLIGPCKSKSCRRDVPVPPATEGALRRWLLSAPESALVFPNGAGKVESHTNIWKRVWTPIMQDAGLVDPNGKPSWGLHMLRHVAVSLWIEQECPLKQVSVWAGHSSVRFTLDRYGHLWPQEQVAQEIARRIEASVLEAH